MKRIVVSVAPVLGALALAACGGGQGGGSGGQGAGGGTCAPDAAQGIAVARTDFYGGTPYALGYPPYAIDGCQLAYVKPGSGGTATGDLVLRDLATGTETVLAPAADQPRRPAIAGELVAWEATVAGTSAVRVRSSSGSAVVSVVGPFDHAGEPRVAAGSVIFTGWMTAMDLGDTDVFLYAPSSGTLTNVTSAPGQQRFADVSATHLAWSDFSEGPSGAFTMDGTDAADIVIFDRAAQVKSVRAQPGKQAFPMLGAEGKIAYLDWGLVHPEPKFSQYTLRVGDIPAPVGSDAVVEVIQAEVPYIRPITRGAYMEWVALSGTSVVLRRQAVDLATPVQQVSAFQGVTVFGPSASDAITLVAATSAGAGVTLQAFAR
jgi:hypothetical protein